MDDNNAITLTICTLIVAVLVAVLAMIATDRRQERIMIEHGMCYQYVQIPNANHSFQYQICK